MDVFLAPSDVFCGGPMLAVGWLHYSCVGAAGKRLRCSVVFFFFFFFLFFDRNALERERKEYQRAVGAF